MVLGKVDDLDESQSLFGAVKSKTDAVGGKFYSHRFGHGSIGGV